MESQRAIKSRPVTPIEILERFHTYREASRPFIKLHTDLMNTQIKSMVFRSSYPNPKLGIQYTDEYYILKKQIDEQLKFLQKELLGELSIERNP